MEVKVFSWNVLSDVYFDKKHFPTQDDAVFDSLKRAKQVLSRIQKEIDEKAIIALQDVCDFVMPSLVKLAITKGYTIRDASYGSYESGRLAVVLMWPTHLYKLTFYRQSVVADHIEHEAPVYKQSWWEWITRADLPPCPLENAKSRPNVLILASLTCGSTEFSVAVYTLPRFVGDLRVARYHLETVMNLCNMQPLILCLDMGVTPSSPLYKYMEEKNMVTAHSFEGVEPEFTINYPLKATVDYIWLSKSALRKVDTLMPREKNPIIPNLRFPSDHLWTEATLKLK